jgi:hypothetical protein
MSRGSKPGPRGPYQKVDEGMRAKEIAKALGMTVPAVWAALRSAYRKLACDPRAIAILSASAELAREGRAARHTWADDEGEE